MFGGPVGFFQGPQINRAKRQSPAIVRAAQDGLPRGYAAIYTCKPGVDAGMRATARVAPTFIAVSAEVVRVFASPVKGRGTAKRWWDSSHVPRPSRFPPRGIAAAVGTKNMPPACFLNVPTQAVVGFTYTNAE